MEEETLIDTLERLALTFTVRDIMVTKEELVSSQDEDEAQKLLDKYPDYDIIPIKKKGELVAYLERGSKQSKYILLHDVISDGTSILDLVDLL